MSRPLNHPKELVPVRIFVFLHVAVMFAAVAFSLGPTVVLAFLFDMIVKPFG